MGIKINKLSYKEDVYDIEVDKNNNFYANGILIHNCVEIALHTVPLRNINDDGTDLVRLEIPKENLQEFLTWRSNQGMTLNKL